jgi:MscS family membrane protein
MSPVSPRSCLCLPGPRCGPSWLPAARTAALAVVLVVRLGTAVRAAEEGPLAPLDMSSPRATLLGFMATVDRVAANFDRINRERAVREENARLIRRGLACLDLSAVPPALADSKGRETAVLIKEVLDRVEIPAAETIPDAPRVKADGIDRWRLPGTEIVLVRLASGPRSGEFVFSAETVARAEEFFAAARQLPYRADAGSPGLLDAYIQLGGSMIPERLIRALPSWAHTVVGGETIWQWLATAVVAAVAVALTLAGWRLRCAARDATTPGTLERLLLPALLVAAGSTIDYLCSAQIRLTGDTIVAAKVVTRLITLVGVVIGVLDLVAWATDRLLGWRRIGHDSIEGQLVRLGSSVGRFLIVVWILIATADSLGVPVTPLVAGLGAGGLAIALASQYTVENLIAGLVIFADKPVRIGDECQYGTIRGRVERIGLRSTRIRGTDQSLISIPNAEFAKSQLVNYSSRSRIPLTIVLTLPTTRGAAALESRLERLREIVATHPGLDHAASTVRLGEPVADGVRAQIDGVFLGGHEPAALACRETLLLRAVEVIAAEDAADARPPRLSAA